MNRNGIEPGDLHLLKLSAGCDSLETLEMWQREREQQYGRRFHRTRMMPRRRDELLADGSIYWVIKGFIQARQRILAFESLDLVKEDSEEVERHTLHFLAIFLAVGGRHVRCIGRWPRRLSLCQGRNRERGE